MTALEDFKAGKTRVLVATDIAARGIDISELSHVFNYDLPEVPETYVHRIGRTARAGADGTAVSFCAPEEKEYLMSKMFPPMIVGGFTTVTITSVIIASVFAKMF